MHSRLAEGSWWRIGIAIFCIVLAAIMLLVSGQYGPLNIALVLVVLTIPAWMFIGWRQDKKRSAIKLWKSRRDWSHGRAKSDVQKRPILYWAGTLVMVCLIVFLFPVMRTSFREMLYFLLLLAGTIYCLTASIQASIRWLRFGPTYFQCDSLPFSPGGTVSGHIKVGRNASFQEDICVRLECLRITHDRAQGDTDASYSIKETALWSAQEFIAPEKIAFSPTGGRIIYASFQIPHDAPETLNEFGNQIVWRLAVNPGINSGINYRDRFQVPVFGIDSNMAISTERYASKLHPA